MFILTAIHTWHMDSRRYISGLHVVTNDNSAFIPIVAPRIVSPSRRNRCCVCVYVYKRGDGLLHVGVCCKPLASKVLCMGSTLLTSLLIGYGAACGGLWTTLVRVTISHPIFWVRWKLWDEESQTVSTTEFFRVYGGNINLMFLCPCIIDTII